MEAVWIVIEIRSNLYSINTTPGRRAIQVHG